MIEVFLFIICLFFMVFSVLIPSGCDLVVAGNGIFLFLSAFGLGLS